MTMTLCDECFKKHHTTVVLCLGLVGIHKCDKCGKEIDCWKERYYVVYKKQTLTPEQLELMMKGTI